MIQKLLVREEGKTLEFKLNASSLFGIIKTVVAFANTAGGTIVVGIEDKTKRVVGLADPLEDEMRITNSVGSILLSIWLILNGLIAFGISFPNEGSCYPCSRSSPVF